MKKKLLFLFAVLTLGGSPQSGDIDTLYYLRSIHYFLKYYLANVHYTIFNLSLKSPVSYYHTLKVYDALGNLVATLVEEYKPAGSYEIELNPASRVQHPASGICFCQLKAGDFVQTKKMILLR